MTDLVDEYKVTDEHPEYPDETDVISYQYLDEMLKAKDLDDLKKIFADVKSCITGGDIAESDRDGFIADVVTVIKNHCINIARNFAEEEAQRIEAACEAMLRWLSSPVVRVNSVV